MASLFFDADSRRITMWECRAGAGDPLTWAIAALCKGCRIRLTITPDDLPAVRCLDPFEVLPEQFPQDTWDRVGKSHGELIEAGFKPVVCHQIDDPSTRVRFDVITYGSVDGRAIAQVKLRRFKLDWYTKYVASVAFISPDTSGQTVVTTSAKVDLLWPATHEVHRDRKAGVAALWETHRQAIARRVTVDMKDEAAVREVLRHYHQSLIDFQVERGVFVPRPEREVALVPVAEKGATELSDSQTPSKPAPVAPPSPADARQNAILYQLDKLQQSKANWRSGLLLLVLSALVFVGAGSAVWSWHFALMLVPILLIHELGHFVAMKAFGYRNLRMFFIPLLGAAVSGRSYNVAGWKKVIVYLMGPLPGIAIGAVLGIAGLITGIEWMSHYALLSLIVNALNLLPILPLDGGWVVHVTLASRHPGIDVAFRVLAAAVLLLGFALMQDRALLAIGILMVVGMPAAYKLARVTHELRRERLGPNVGSDDQIPTPTALAIIERIEGAFPRGLSAKHAARHTLHVFEAVAQRPPHILLSFGFLGLHGAAFCVALLVTMVLVIGQMTDLGAFFNMAASQPLHAFTPHDMATTQSPDQVPPPEGQVVTIISQFPDRTAAESFYLQAAAEVPAHGTLTRFGLLVMCELPAESEAREAWMQRMESVAGHVVVQRDDYPIHFNLMGIAPHEAAAIEHEKQVTEAMVFEKSARLIPPWHPMLAPTAEQTKARHTYALLLSPPEDARVTELQGQVATLSEQIVEAYRKGQQGRIEQIQQQQAELQRQVQARRTEVVRELGPEAVDLDLIDAYMSQPTFDWNKESSDEEYQAYQQQWQAWQSGMCERMGMVPRGLEGLTYTISSGMIERTGLIESLYYVVFDRPATGLPRMVAWMEEQGLISIRYELVDSGGFVY